MTTYPPYPGVSGSLQTLKNWLVSGKPFTHARYNDGEFITMFGNRPSSDTIGDGCHVFVDLSEALRDSFRRLYRETRKQVFIGSYFINPLYHPSQEPNLGLEMFVSFLKSERIDVANINWLAGDFWYSTSAEREGVVDGGDELLALCNAVRDYSESCPVVLIGNKKIESARHCLGAHFIPVPAIDAWIKRDYVLWACSKFALDDALYIWCGGMASKVFAASLSEEYPNTRHIDFGSVFDGVFGDISRTWLERQSGPHWEFYMDKFMPFVLRWDV